MAIRARVDRHKCIGAGNCITLAPTAFDWLAGDYGKSDVVGPDSVDEEVLRAAAFACPTAAVILEDVSELFVQDDRQPQGSAALPVHLGRDLYVHIACGEEHDQRAGGDPSET